MIVTTFNLLVFSESLYFLPTIAINIDDKMNSTGTPRIPAYRKITRKSKISNKILFRSMGISTNKYSTNIIADHIIVMIQKKLLMIIIGFFFIISPLDYNIAG